MLFSLIGIGVFTYGVIFTLLSLLSDCDLQLLFYEKFGKSPRRLKGKVVFITGASSGIGEHIAYALAKCGVRLVLAARRNEELQRVKRNCIDSSKGLLEDRDVLVIQMDVTDTASHRKHFQHAVLHFGRVDILVNNAGRSQRAMWATTEMSVDRQLFDLNVFGVVSLTRVALEHFDKVGCGHVAVVSSLAGILPVPYSGTYTASKHAIHKYNGSVQPSDKRMTAERCGYLSAVALANKTSESWIAVFPLISFTYIAVYFPIVFNIALRLLGPETLFKLRDSKDLDEMTEYGSISRSTTVGFQ
ncbi:dehydrogenase/reductase SDR family member 7 isoform X3 [Leptinotarsa decemlineata]|uniref:dehydrogenase/reductase SDR family member 7 isoform X3 n=1 Tax=Leptinotarsa decemlineata TaxID=7539 RepID=UPI003D30AC81